MWPILLGVLNIFRIFLLLLYVNWPHLSYIIAATLSLNFSKLYKISILLCEFFVKEEPPESEELFSVEICQSFFPVEPQLRRPLDNVRTKLKKHNHLNLLLQYYLTKLKKTQSIEFAITKLLPLTSMLNIDCPNHCQPAFK